MDMPSPERLARRERVLMELTQIPTAAGREQRVHAYVERLVAALNASTTVLRDDVGNWLIWGPEPAGEPSPAAPVAPVLFTAHLDHPAFVVTAVDPNGEMELEFRGGVNDPYFTDAHIEVITAEDARLPARIRALDAQAKPFKKARARLEEGAPSGARVQVGDIARWLFPRAEILDGCLHTDACDDLAAAAAALCVLEELLQRDRAPGAPRVGVLLTVAEEVGFVGAIHAARNGFVPRNADLVCLENSRSFPQDSPIGAGAILRVGDRLSVFTPDLTNRLTQLFAERRKTDPAFTYQRKLMAGGACEATAFASFGYRSTCLCLPLGNYHNMVDIDGVAAGTTPARTGREFISLADFHGLCAMLHAAAEPPRMVHVEPYDALMNRLYAQHSCVLR